jgi:hypothetical protein
VLPEDRILCLFTRQKFTPDHIQQAAELCRQRPPDWGYILETAEKGGVAPLVYVNLSRSLSAGVEAPPETIARFKRAYVQNILVKKDTAGILNLALGLLGQKNLEVMLVKGAAHSLVVYDQPWYTVSGDVDLVIGTPQGRVSAGDRAQIDHFFKQYNDDAARHRVSFEYDYGVHHDFTMNDVVAVDSNLVWDEAHKVHCGDFEVRVMRPEDMLIAACINSCRKRYFRLKSMCDIATILEKYPQLDWELLADRARDWSCRGIVYTAVQVTRAVLGCSLPAGSLESLKVSPLRAALIRFLMKTMLKQGSIKSLSERSSAGLGERKLSWGLLLTYASYTRRQVSQKLGQLKK